MKRIVFAGLVALALTAVSQQKASAWGWQLTGSWSIGANWQCWGNCPQGGVPAWAASSYGYPAPAYAYYGGATAPAPVYATAPQAQPAAPAAPLPQGPAVAVQPSVQPIGYYYYGGYGNYGYYQAPSYWYGR
jgi:hypothetical protein